MGHLKGVKPGDELLHTSAHRQRGSTGEPKKVTVHKVGTKLVHILRIESSPSSGTDGYRIDNGVGNDHRNGQLWKLEDWELEKERPELENKLKRHDVEVWRRPLPVPVLKKLLAVMEESKE